MQESMQNTGAVVMGWNAYAMAKDPDWYAGHYEFQVPVFVLTREVPKRLPKQTDKLTFTSVTEGVESAVRQAKAAAGDKDVVVMPVLLGGGLRLFEDIGLERIRLERMRVMELPGGRTHLRFRVLR